MGLLTSAGSTARVLGPIMVSYVYDATGVYLTFGIILITMSMALTVTIVLYKRMVPFQLPEMSELDEEGGGKAQVDSKRDSDSD